MRNRAADTADSVAGNTSGKREQARRTVLLLFSSFLSFIALVGVQTRLLSLPVRLEVVRELALGTARRSGAGQFGGGLSSLGGWQMAGLTPFDTCLP